jgi:hypothetical protein
MLVALKEIHSSSGKLKNVKQASIERLRNFIAEGRSFSHLPLKVSKNSRSFFFDEA